MGTKIIIGNALEVLPTLKERVHCSVSSPPYFGLRKYSGDQACDWPKVEYSPISGLPTITIEPMTCALGHEETIETYIGHLVAIYREVWRVLRDDSVAWIVIGDSYARQAGDDIKRGTPNTGQARIFLQGLGREGMGSNKPPSGLRQGDLMLVPHRLALALQADGWTVRNDVIWAKVAPMPESVSGWRWEKHRIKAVKSDRATNPFQAGAGTKQGAGVASRAQREAYYEQGKGAPKWIDCPGCPKCDPNDGYILKRGSWRHTRAHEFVFMLSKKMQYWADQEMVREALSESSIDRMNQPTFHKQTGGPKDYGSGSNRSARKMLENLEQSRSGRNPRSVLSPSPEPFPGSHFAVYPTSLIEPLIKATCPMQCCPECGTGWSPVVKRKRTGEMLADGSLKTSKKSRRADVPGSIVANPDSMFRTGTWHSSNVVDYRPTCDCGRNDYVPGTVLDQFIGGGTTGLVADRLGLNCIGIDISGEYARDIAAPRIKADAPLLAHVEVIQA